MKYENFKSVYITGRQPALAIAELESLLGAKNIQPLGNQFALSTRTTDELSFARLGGSMRACKILTELPFTDWRKINDYLVEHVPKHTCCFGPGKLTFGITAYNLKTSAKAIMRTSLEVKKVVRAERPVRVVLPDDTELSSAQVLHNKMAELPYGMELVLIGHGKSTLLAQTTAIQDIDAYSARDQARPKRDTRVGMLPPKLAQIIVNLAVGKEQNLKSILDPFCGTGVILQEALLMGYDAYGTDLEPRMIEFSQANLDWLTERKSVAGTYRLQNGDATALTWDQPFDAIAAETYLGRPFSAAPPPDVLRQVISDVNLIHKKFLANVARQTKPGFKMCIAVPAWKLTHGFQHLKVLDSLPELGYTRVSFVHAKTDDLIYHRENQIVGRELVVLTRI